MIQKKQDQINKLVKELDGQITNLENAKNHTKAKHIEVLNGLEEELELLNLKKEGLQKIK